MYLERQRFSYILLNKFVVWSQYAGVTLFNNIILTIDSLYHLPGTLQVLMFRQYHHFVFSGKDLS